MKVKDVMNVQVVAVKETTTIKELAKIFREHGIGSAPVIDHQGHVTGLITERDLLEAIYPTLSELAEPASFDFERMENRAIDILDHPVKQYMRRNVITVLPDIAALRAGSILIKNNIKRLPVVDPTDNKTLLGILSQADILRGIFYQKLGLGGKKAA